MGTEITVETDVLVIGGGMAGLFAAIKARERGVDVTLVDKGYVGKTGATRFAEGDLIFFRPERGHDLKAWVDRISERCEYVNNREWTEILLSEAKDRYEDLIGFGIQFYEENGKPYIFSYYGDHSKYENISMKQGEYSQTLRKIAVEKGVRVLDRIMSCELLVTDGKIAGAIAFHVMSGNLYIFRTRAIVIATGATSLKAVTYPINFWSGDGDAMAYRAGVEIANKEYMRGLGRPLRAEIKQREKIMDKAKISREIIDVATRFPSIITSGFTGWFVPNLNAENGLVVDPAWEAHYGRAPLYLDIGLWPPERLEWLRTFFKRIGTAQPDKIGLDVLRGGKIEWPSSRLMLISIFVGSGIRPMDTTCATRLPGLYAAGNCCATMAGNAVYAGMGFGLTHAMVTGHRAGLGAVEYASQATKTDIDEVELKKVKGDVCQPLERKGGFSPRWLAQVLQGLTVPYFVFWVKHGERLNAVLTMVEFINRHLVPKLVAKDSHEWRLCYEVMNMSLVCEMMLRASLFRTESRGMHFREDYPRRDDPAWLAWIMLRKDEGEMQVFKEPIPEKWWPDLSKSYEERYPSMLPME